VIPDSPEGVTMGATQVEVGNAIEHGFRLLHRPPGICRPCVSQRAGSRRR
jgi:hypothetical protein